MVDTKCCFPNEKYKKRESSALNSEALPEDEHLLRRPMRTSCTGFKEAKKAYENGTDEVRLLLIEECSLIYECNMCRNLFRSLPNFISHKRNYCKSSTSDSVHSFPDRSSRVVIQTVECSEPLLVKSRSMGSSPIPNTKSSNRDLSKVIERLKRVEVSAGNRHNKNLSVECKMRISSLEPKAPDPVLELERVSSTTQAVYQTFKMKDDTGSIKTELEEVHNLLTNQNIYLGPDGKAISPPLMSFNLSSLKDNHETNQLLPEISCEICKMQFQTEKTLKMHFQKNHTSTTYVFQCPTCSMTFLQPAAVIRHLANEHKKPLRRIRKMRDTILKKRIQIGDVQMKGSNREIKRLQMINTKDINNTNLEHQQNGRYVTSCTYCFKNFERRAALATHLTNCLARKKLFGDAEHLMKVSPPNEQNDEHKIQKEISNKFLEYNNRNDIINGERAIDRVNIKKEPVEDLNNSSNINKLFENLENQTFGNGLHTVSLENINMTVELEESEQKHGQTKDECHKEFGCSADQNSERKIKKNNMVSNRDPVKKEKAKRFRMVPASKQLTCRCKICNKQFNALSNLRRHISMFHYRSRRFGCKLCDYRAFRRYDIVNHLTFIHKITGERESMAVEYVTVHETKYSKDDVDGDIVVVNDEATSSEKHKIEHLKEAEEPQIFTPEIPLKTYEKKEKSKKEILQSHKDALEALKINSIALKDKSHVKVVRKRFKKSLEQQVEGKKRPIRNRIKTVNKDFVYDLLTIKEDTKQQSRLAFKRRNTVFADQNSPNIDFTPPPIKITPYRLRTEPLMPSDKSSVKGIAAKVCRNVIFDGLAAPSTLPELPAERPQMRLRLISSARSDSTTVPIIETSELEAAGLKSTFFDDSFLEKFAKKSNPLFKMKPLLALPHSPLNSILQKFDASQQQSIIHRTSNIIFKKSAEKESSSTPDSAVCLLQSLTSPGLKEKEVTPNGKHVLNSPSPPDTPKKRVTLMQRLAENRARAKRKNSIIRTALEN